MKIIVYSVARATLLFGTLFVGVALDEAWPGNGVAIGWLTGACWAGIVAPQLEETFSWWMGRPYR